MTGWYGYFFAFFMFFLSHSIPVRPAVKARLVSRLGQRGFTIAYSALSTAMLVWVIVAAGRAPFIELWDWALWQNHVTLTCMFLACVIAAMAIGRPNPLSFGGAHNDRFEPSAPGLVGWVRHPLLAALLLWALGHMVPNGNLAHLILFGLFAGFSLLGAKIINRRQKRIMGEARWHALTQTRRELRLTTNGVLRFGIGVAVYLTLIGLHGPVIGVSPLF